MQDQLRWWVSFCFVLTIEWLDCCWLWSSRLLPFHQQRSTSMFSDRVYFEECLEIRSASRTWWDIINRLNWFTISFNDRNIDENPQATHLGRRRRRITIIKRLQEIEWSSCWVIPTVNWSSHQKCRLPFSQYLAEIIPKVVRGVPLKAHFYAALTAAISKQHLDLSNKIIEGVLQHLQNDLNSSKFSEGLNSINFLSETMNISFFNSLTLLNLFEDILVSIEK